MSPKRLKLCCAIALLALSTAVVPAVASAHGHGGHSGHGGHGGHGGHAGHGGGFRGYGFSGVFGVPYDFYFEGPPACDFVPVKYYYRGRAYWRSVWRCW